MKISACIVTYNAISTASKKEELCANIESLLAQTEGDFKLYLVDNASQDGTADFVEQTYNSVTVIRNSENLGFGAAHNAVLDSLDSDYHFVVNPDILVEGRAVNTLAEYLAEHPEVGAVNPLVKFPSGEIQPLAKVQPKFRYLFANRFAKDRETSKLVREYCKADADYTKPLQVENLSGCFIGVPTKLFKELGGFDEDYFMYFEDYDLARRIMKTKTLAVVPQAVVFHSWERDSKVNKKLLLIHIKSMFTYIFKWGMGI